MPSDKLQLEFWMRVEETDDCWNWNGPLSGKGYGLFHFGGRRAYAHRTSWQLANGEIPRGAQIDHSCFNHKCVNPGHLSPVTHKQNQENRSGASRRSKTGVRGVSWYEPYGKYRARVGHNGKTITVGYYATLAEAELAVIAKRNELFSNNLADRRGENRDKTAHVAKAGKV